VPVERGNYVKFKIGKAWVNGLIDTGSVSTLINLTLARRLGLRWKQSKSGEAPILFSANGSQLVVTAVTEVTLNFLGLRLPCTLKIVENLMHDFILGADFLRENSAIIDYNANALSLADGLVSLPLQNYTVTQIAVRTVEAICIPPYTEALVPVFCPRRFNDTAILIEPFSRI